MRLARQVRIESEILAGQHLGNKNYLRGVTRKMLHHMKDRLEYGPAVALDGDFFRQTLGRQRSDDRQSLVHSFAQQLAERSRRHAAARREFRVAMTRIRLSPDAAQNPLSDVAVQVKYQVPRRILVLRSPHPDLLRGELAKADFNPRAQLRQLLSGALEEIGFDSHDGSLRIVAECD